MFQISIARILSLQIGQMLEIFSGVEFLRTVSKLTKRKRKSLSYVDVLSLSNLKLELARRSRTVNAIKCTKKLDARAKL